MASKFASFKQRVTVGTTPGRIYDILMNAKKHAKLTGAPVKMSAKVGGAFTVYDGYAFGKNVELVPGKRIVQSWCAREEGWPEDHFSEVVFDLAKAGKNRTTVTFTHKQVPAALAKSFKDGWREFYWSPLKAMFP